MQTQDTHIHKKPFYGPLGFCPWRPGWMAPES